MSSVDELDDLLEAHIKKHEAGRIDSQAIAQLNGDRGAPAKDKMVKKPQAEAVGRFCGQRGLRLLALVFLWYAFSIGLSVFNKEMFGKKHGDLPAPLLFTSFQFLTQYYLASWTIFYCHHRYGTYQYPRLTMTELVKHVLPVSAWTALDIGLSNLALQSISLSLYTILKSPAPMYILLLCLCLGLEEPSCFLGFCTLLICSGVSLACSGAIIEYQWHGILLCMGASVASAFRWVSSQFAMSREDLGIDDPITLVYAVMPQMSVFLFVLSLIFERPWVTLPESPYFASGLSILVTLILVSVGSVLAFGLVNIEYKIVKEFSALTLSIAGQVKEAFTILCSVLIFGDPLSAANVIGLGVVMIGVLLYRKAKIEMKEDRDARSQSRRLQPSPEPSAPPLPSAAQKAAVAAATARSTRVKDKKPGPAFVVNMSREGSFE
mmetsp:Transcript_1331/g.4614  ORF Transcript_1331/g.4614 Transcript_1331/m.4614 type:complete len:435 (-) Transcript_1331:75-1379(-)